MARQSIHAKILFLFLALAPVSCSKDVWTDAPRRPSAVLRTAGEGTSGYVPVTFTQRSGASPFVSMPEGFSFTSFRFLTRTADDPSAWWPQLGSIARWQTPGDSDTPFLPTDATTTAWPMADGRTSTHLTFFAGAVDEAAIRDLADYDLGADPDVTEFLCIPFYDEEYGFWDSEFRTYSEYADLYAYGASKAWVLSARADGGAELTVRNPWHFVDFVAAVSPDNGAKEAVPLGFSHVLSRIEGITVDWRNYWNWRSERAVGEDALVITSIEVTDGSEASFTFAEDGTGTFVPQSPDWTASAHWTAFPTVGESDWSYWVGYDPEHDQDIYENYRTIVTPPGFGGAVDDPYAAYIWDALPAGSIYMSLAGDQTEDQCIARTVTASPLLPLLMNPSFDDIYCTAEEFGANPHRFGHPTLFPGRHAIRIRMAKVLSATGDLERDYGQPPHEEYDDFGNPTGVLLYPYKEYSLTGTFTLPQGASCRLVLTVNPNTDLIDMNVDATLSGWTVDGGGATTL